MSRSALCALAPFPPWQNEPLRSLCSGTLSTLAPFPPWQHNEEHHHSNLALFTPAEVFFGRVEEVRKWRQDALNQAYAAHPERFPNGKPCARLPPQAVHINPVSSSAVELETAISRGESEVSS